MNKILIDVRIFEQGLKRLEKIPNVYIEVIEAEERLRLLPAELIQDKDILFCTFPPENFSEMKSLKFIQITSAGYSQLFNLGLAEKNIRACNARGVFDVPIAEWNIAMIINLARDLRCLIRNQESCIWDRSAKFQSEVRGSVVGIWGYGGVGRETARLAKAMGMTVSVLELNKVVPRENMYLVAGAGDKDGILPDKVYTIGQKIEFLSELDFLILAMPLTKKTDGIVGENELKALPNHAYLLNPARGPLIKEDALLKALRENWIAGAALDTHYSYPMPADHPLWRFPNVIMTPHISGSSLSSHFLERIWDIFCQNMERYLAKQPLINELITDELSET